MSLNEFSLENLRACYRQLKKSDENCCSVRVVNKISLHAFPNVLPAIL